MATAPLSLPRNDPREGGRWTFAQTLKNQGIYVAVQVALFLVAPFPARWLRALGRGLGVVVYALGAAPRRIARENLARVYPQKTAAERDVLARRVYQQLGTYLGAAVAQLASAGRFIPLPFEEGSRGVLEDAVHEGRGVLFASAHLGPWEQVAGSLVHHGFPLTTLARESYDPRFMRLYARLRGGVGVKAIYRGRPSSALRIVRTLRGGGLLGAPMDLRSRVASIEAPFLGEAASTPVGPARLALRTGAAVVVGTPVAGLSGSLAIRVTRIATHGLEPGSAGELALTTRLNDEISARIRAFPEGWVWMHPRWDRATA